jgi:DNA-3-methyladenine glycosylase I
MSDEHHERQPERPRNDDEYFEKLTHTVFQTGFSWKVIRSKWPSFQEAFDGFDLDKVAEYDERDLERLLANKDIVRNARKIQATVDNARLMQRLIAEHGSFQAYLRSLDRLSWQDRRKTLSKTFNYLGPTGVYFFLWSVGEEVPPWEERDR